MNPCEFNAAVAAVANLLFTSLSKEDFVLLNIFLNELSKSMFAMELYRKVLKFEEKKEENKNNPL